MSNENAYYEAVSAEQEKITSSAHLNRKRRCPVCGPKMERAMKKFKAEVRRASRKRKEKK